MTRIRWIAPILLALLAPLGGAQEHEHGAGEKLGAVHFATSCNDVAQTDLDRAVALLHSFQFSRAIEGFNATLGDDATCAIAYWGICSLAIGATPLRREKKTRTKPLPTRASERGHREA